MADTPQEVDSLERIRKALETQALTHPGVAICDKSDLRSLLAREAALREALKTARDHIDMDALEISHCNDADQIRAALASTEPTKEAR